METWQTLAMIRYAALILAALFAFLSDQGSKYYITDVLNMPLNTETPVIPPYLNFKHVANPGINFGLFGGNSAMMRWVLVGVALLVIVLMLYWIRKRLWHRPTAIFAGLLIGGALGNVYDRVTQGYVTDFINNSLPIWHNPFAYNLADVWVFVGIFGLVLFEPKKNH